MQQERHITQSKVVGGHDLRPMLQTWHFCSA